MNHQVECPQSSRLRFRLPTKDDASFYNALMNEPDYHRFIADRGIRTDEVAADYIESKPLVHFAEHKVGLWLVELKNTGEPIGSCGLVVRKELDYPDLGYAFLQEHRGLGYALEAAAAVLEHVESNTAIPRLCAITHTENTRSTKLLLKLGFVAHGQRLLEAYGGISDYFVFEVRRHEA